MSWSDFGVSPILGWSILGFIAANLLLMCIYLVQLLIRDQHRANRRDAKGTI